MGPGSESGIVRVLSLRLSRAQASRLVTIMITGSIDGPGGRTQGQTDTLVHLVTPLAA